MGNRQAERLQGRIGRTVSTYFLEKALDLLEDAWVRDDLRKKYQNDDPFEDFGAGEAFLACSMEDDPNPVEDSE